MTINVDQPFLFVIRDTKHQITKLIGKIVNPNIISPVIFHGFKSTPKFDIQSTHLTPTAVNTSTLLSNAQDDWKHTTKGIRN